MTLTVASLCSGYEATGLGLTLAGWDHRLVFVADPDPAASKALAHHHPDVQNLGDTTRVAWDELGLAGEIDLMHMGFPCTDVSCSGRRQGLTEDIVIPAGKMACGDGCWWADHDPQTCEAASPDGCVPSRLFYADDEAGALAAVAALNARDRELDNCPPERVVKGTRSGVWSYCRDAIAELRPRLVLIENVAGLLSTPANRSTDGTDSGVESGPAGLGDRPGRSLLRAAGAVLGDLASIGYDAVWLTVSAASVGAPHLRKRVFILAWPAADPPRFGHRDSRPAGVGGVPAATVAGGAQAGELSLLPTPRARDVKGAETETTRAGRIERGTAHAGHDLPTALSLLPTPAARDAGRGFGYGDQPGRPLSETIARLLPTPTAGDGTAGPGNSGREGSPNLRTEVTLLPTPRATDGTKGGPNQRGSSGDLMLPSAVMLLPTPTVADSRGSRNATSGRSDGAEFNSGTTLSDVAYADRWGDYAPAIARWEQIIGRPAPEPTEPGKNGQPRLSARFVEWMQGLPDGYVTAVPGISRNEALRLLGNANPPQQYAAAIAQLAAIVAAVTAKEAA